MTVRELRQVLNGRQYIEIGCDIGIGYGVNLSLIKVEDVLELEWSKYDDLEVVDIVARVIDSKNSCLKITTPSISSWD